MKNYLHELGYVSCFDAWLDCMRYHLNITKCSVLIVTGDEKCILYNSVKHKRFEANKMNHHSLNQMPGFIQRR